MAAVTAAAVSAASGTDAVTYSTGSFTPAANDLVVVAVSVGAQTATDWNLVDSLGGTFSKITRSTFTTSADILEIWVANSLAAASARTLTYSHASGTATGGFIQPLLVSGMTRTGPHAVRGSGIQDNQALGTTPAPVMTQAALTANPVISCVCNSTNPGAVTVPGSFTSRFNAGHTATVKGMCTASRDSGHTSATVTWGGTSASAFGSLAIELDISVQPPIPDLLIAPNLTAEARP